MINDKSNSESSEESLDWIYEVDLCVWWSFTVCHDFLLQYFTVSILAATKHKLILITSSFCGPKSISDDTLYLFNIQMTY